MYHGTRQSNLEFYPAICFTIDETSAAAYGHHVHEVDIDDSHLTILDVEMDEAELRYAIDNQEWPCDQQADIDKHIAEGYTAVRYIDVDENGQMHDCIRILTRQAYLLSVKEMRR